MKTKGTKHDKYTNDYRYNNTVVLRLDNFQTLEIEDLCSRYKTTKSAVIRLAINQLIKSLEE